MKFPKKSLTWLVTGVAGFIGSHILETLLANNQRVLGVDNLFTGSTENLERVLRQVGRESWKNFSFYNEDIRDKAICNRLCKRSNLVLHQAAVGSVSRSIKDPNFSHDVNVNGFLNMLEATRKSQCQRFIFASSSSVYGNDKSLPKIESVVGDPLSPYATTKKINEIYAEVYAKTYGLKYIGLRYFNVFGERQDPNGPYAAVIPKWAESLLKGKKVYIYGDGKTSRDFCYVGNVVQANLRAALTENSVALNQIYNIAYGEKTSLNKLFKLIKSELNVKSEVKPVYEDFREGDIRHSHADISKATKNLGYLPKYSIHDGIKRTLSWFKQDMK
jgi:UDP-N-acetylglucosamine 4-epimerase